jgi:outer membrane immunogenic protein
MRLFQGALILAAGVAIQFFPASLPAAAQSGDIPYTFVPLWNGLYLGVHGGGALASTGIADNYHYNYYYSGNDSSAPLSSAKNSIGGPGALGGAQLGYNFQWRQMMFGLEGDAGYLYLPSASKSATLKPSQDCLSDHWTVQGRCAIGAKYSSQSAAYGDLTGRLGLVLGRTMLYGKGGGAVMQDTVKASYTGATSIGSHTYDFDPSGIVWGWTAGGGVEYALSTSWSLKAEYQHFDFLDASFDHSGSTSVNSWHGQQTYMLKGSAAVSPAMDTVKLGVNFHLSDEAELK